MREAVAGSGDSKWERCAMALPTLRPFAGDPGRSPTAHPPITVCAPEMARTNLERGVALVRSGMYLCEFKVWPHEGCIVARKLRRGVAARRCGEDGLAGKDVQ
jgi:hypothetical protein